MGNEMATTEALVTNPGQEHQRNQQCWQLNKIQDLLGTPDQQQEN